MAQAALWGLVGGSSLLLGAAAGLRWTPGQRQIGLVMSFGAGVLVSAVAFELTQEAFVRGGFDAVGIGLALGALAFTAGDAVIERRGGGDRKRSGGQQEGGSAMAIAFGAALDGLPESIVIGAGLAFGGSVSVPVVAAVFVSNVPESLSSAVGLRRAGFAGLYVMGLWLVVTATSAVASALGYGLVGKADPNIVAGVQAFAGGALLAMLADTILPEAYREAGKLTGLVTVLGFALAFFLARPG